jgi:hypothetical protein
VTSNSFSYNEDHQGQEEKHKPSTFTITMDLMKSFVLLDTTFIPSDVEFLIDAELKKTWTLGKLVSGTNDCFKEPGEQTRS